MSDIMREERRSCYDSALRCFGAAYVFEQRMKPLISAQKLLALFSLAGPLSIGLLVIVIGMSSKLLPVAITIAVIFSGIQTIISLWSLVAKWSDSIAFYVEAKVGNYQLAGQFMDLGDDTGMQQSQWRTKYAVLEACGEHRANLDLRAGFTDEEKRMAMRAALREYGQQCAGCREVPASLVATTCGVCGNFQRRWWKWLM